MKKAIGVVKALKTFPVACFCGALLLGGISSASSGCRTRRAPIAPTATAERMTAQQARDRKAQQYILKRREAARKNNRAGSVH